MTFGKILGQLPIWIKQSLGNGGTVRSLATRAGKASLFAGGSYGLWSLLKGNPPEHQDHPSRLNTRSLEEHKKFKYTPATKIDRRFPLFASSGKNTDRRDTPNERVIDKESTEAMADTNPPISSKVFFHVHANSFGKNSRLEGSQHAELLQFLIHFITSRSASAESLYGIDEILLKELQHASDIASHKNDRDLMHRLFESSMKSGEPLLIPGGWIGNPVGHAMYYEIIPGSDGKFNFRLFNLGAGADIHKTYLVGNKIKLNPGIEWRGIKTLPFQFIEEMLMYHTDPRDNTPTDYGIQDIYGALREVLKPEEEVILDYEGKELLMTPQYPGICAWRSLQAFLRCKLPEEKYKKLMLDIKIESLIEKVNSLISDAETIPCQYHLFKKSFQKVSRKLIKAYHKGLIDFPFLESNIEKLQKVYTRLRSDRSALPGIGLKGINYVSTEEGLLTGGPRSFTNKSLHELFVAHSASQPSTPRPSRVIEQMRELRILTPESVSQNLDYVAFLCKESWAKGAARPLHIALMDYIKNLPIEKEFWRDACQNEPKKAEDLIMKLGELSKYAFKSSYIDLADFVLHPERAYVQQKLLFIQHTLGSVIDKRWSKVVYLPGYDGPSLQYRRGVRFYDRVIHQDLFYIEKKKEQPLEPTKEDRRLNRPSRYFMSMSGEQGATMEFYFPECPFSLKGNVFALIEEMYPEIHTKIEKRYPGYLRSKKNVQYAYICNSEYLPVWIKCIFDTYLSAQWLESRPTIMTKKVSEAGDLDFVLQRKKGRVMISVQGAPDYKQYWDFYRYSRDNLFTFKQKYFESTLYRRFENFYNEESLVAKRPEYKEEMFDLYHINLKKKSRLFKLIEYFTKYSEKLDDPDYRGFFKLNLFKTYGILQSLQNEPEYGECFRSILEKFFEERYNFALEHNKISTAVFICQMLGRLQTFYPDSTPVNSSIARLKSLLKDHIPDERAKGLIFAELLAQFSKKNHLDDDDIPLFLSALLYHSMFSENESEIDPETEKCARDAVFIHALQIERYLYRQGVNHDLLNTLTQHVLADGIVRRWDRVNRPQESPIYKSHDDYYYYPLQNKLYLHGKQQSYRIDIPVSISNHLEFKKLFPGIVKAEEFSNDIYAFTDKFGHRVLVNKDVVIEKEISGKLYRYDRNLHEYYPGFHNLIKNTYKSRYLADRYSRWISLDNPNVVLFINNETDQQCYMRTENLNFVDLSTGLRLGQPSDILKRFEEEGFIHEWYDENRSLVKIDFPRYKLTFTPRQEGENHRLYCDQVPGFYLSGDPNISELGVFMHYLVLENHRGKKKIVVPYLTLKKPAAYESLIPLFETERDIGSDAGYQTKSYFVYDFDEDGTFRTNSRLGYLYLGYILGVSQKYSRSLNYLQKYGEKLNEYTNEEAQTLRWIVDLHKITGDCSGSGKALRSYAEYLLLKNDDLIGKTTYQSNQYLLYLQDFFNVPFEPLTLHEELFLHRYFPLTNPFIVPRHQELTGRPVLSSTDVMKSDEFSDLTRYKTSERIKFNDLAGIDLGSKYSQEFLVTRIQNSLSRNFRYFYDIALKGTPEQKVRLRHACSFLRHNEDELLAGLFEIIMDNPGEFPSDPGYVSYWDRENWMQKVRAKAQELYDKKDIEGTQVMRAFDKPFERTPAGFSMKFANRDIPRLQFSCLPVWREPLSKKCSSYFTLLPLPEQKGPDSDLITWIESRQDDNPLLMKEYERLAIDFNDYQRIKERHYFTLTKENFDALVSTLKEGKSERRQHLKSLKNEILESANREPDENTEKVIRVYERWGGRKGVTFNDLLLSFGCRSPEKILRINPFLTQSETDLLFTQINEYLLIATEEQQRKRALQICKKLRNPTLNEGERDDLIRLLADRVLAERHEDVEQNPSFLLFEYYGDLMLWQKQVESIRLFLDEGVVNPVLELIMGSGKSQVILPLLALLRADGDKFSLLVVPESLFDDVASKTQRILKDAYSLSLRTLGYDRNTPFTIKSLRNILEDLQHMIANKEALIMTNKSIQCLILKYIEECGRHFTSSWATELSEELTLCSEILNLLRKSGRPIFDEVDTQFKVNHEISFSLGNIHTPNIDEARFVAKIYQLLYTESMFKNLMRLESDPQPYLQSPVITKETYSKSVKKRLAEKVAEILEHYPQTSAYIKGLNADERKNLIRYLCHSRKRRREAQRFYDGIESETVKNYISLAGGQISNLLSHTLMKNYDQNYGVDQDSGDLSAIPFTAAKTPNKKSRFTNRYITMNYTLQNYVKKGIPDTIILDKLKGIQQKATEEIRLKGNKISVKETSAWEFFCLLKGDLNIPLYNLNETQERMLCEHLNGSAESKLAFIAEMLMQEIKCYDKQLTCTPHALVGFFENASGTTGTLWNFRSMHRKLSAYPQAGIDAKTLEILWKKCRDAVILKEGNVEDMLTALKEVPHSMIIDSGGYFKTRTNEQVARHMAAISQNQVVFYNDKGEQTLFDGTGCIPLRECVNHETDRLTYLDQSHTTGADVKQKMDAIGLVTVGRNMLLRDLLQSVWRLRGIERSQKPIFVVSEEVGSIIRQTLTLQSDVKIGFPHILEFCIRNQADQEANDNYKGLKIGLSSIPEIMMMDVLLDDRFTYMQKRQAFLAFTDNGVWIKPSFHSPDTMFGKIPEEVDKDDELYKLVSKYQNLLKNLYDQVPFLRDFQSRENVFLEMNDIVDSVKGHLPNRLISSDMNGDETTEMLQEMRNEVERELEVRHIEKPSKCKLRRREKGCFVDHPIVRFSKGNNYAFPIDKVLELDPKLKEYQTLFPDIWIPQNFLEVHGKMFREPKEIHLLGFFRTPVHFIEFGPENKVYLLSEDDLILKLNREYAANIFNVRLGFITEPHTRKLTPGQFEQVVKIKFLSGECHYTEEEINILEKWMKPHGIEKFRYLFEEHIVAGFPERQENYRQSALQSLFNN